MFKWLAAKTEPITQQSAFNPSPLHWVTWLYGLLNRAKSGYGGIIAQCWLNLSILEWCSRKDVTQSIKCLSIPRWMVWIISGTIIDVREMHFIMQMTPSEVQTAWSSTYCAAFHLSVSSPWVGSIFFWKYSRQSLNCHDNAFPSAYADFGASHTGQWGYLIECKWMFSK